MGLSPPYAALMVAPVTATKAVEESASNIRDALLMIVTVTPPKDGVWVSHGASVKRCAINGCSHHHISNGVFSACPSGKYIPLSIGQVHFNSTTPKTLRPINNFFCRMHVG